jgi:hypothetical protein
MYLSLPVWLLSACLSGGLSASRVWHPTRFMMPRTHTNNTMIVKALRGAVVCVSHMLALLPPRRCLVAEGVHVCEGGRAGRAEAGTRVHTHREERVSLCSFSDIA